MIEARAAAAIATAAGLAGTVTRACAGGGAALRVRAPRSGTQSQGAQNPAAGCLQRPGAGAQGGSGGDDVVDQQDRQPGDRSQQTRGDGAITPPLTCRATRLMGPAAPATQQIRA